MRNHAVRARLYLLNGILRDKHPPAASRVVWLHNEWCAVEKGLAVRQLLMLRWQDKSGGRKRLPRMQAQRDDQSILLRYAGPTPESIDHKVGWES